MNNIINFTAAEFDNRKNDVWCENEDIRCLSTAKRNVILDQCDFTVGGVSAAQNCKNRNQQSTKCPFAYYSVG